MMKTPTLPVAAFWNGNMSVGELLLASKGNQQRIADEMVKENIFAALYTFHDEEEAKIEWERVSKENDEFERQMQEEFERHERMVTFHGIHEGDEVWFQIDMPIPNIGEQVSLLHLEGEEEPTYENSKDISLPLGKEIALDSRYYNTWNFLTSGIIIEVVRKCWDMNQKKWDIHVEVAK